MVIRILRYVTVMCQFYIYKASLFSAFTYVVLSVVGDWKLKRCMQCKTIQLLCVDLSHSGRWSFGSRFRYLPMILSYFSVP